MIYAFRFFRWRIVVNPTNQQPSNWCHSWNMSRPCFRQPVPVKENFSKPPKLRCSKPQGKVINTAVLLPAAVSLTTDFPLTPTPCLGLRVCQVWYIYIFWYETDLSSLFKFIFICICQNCLILQDLFVSGDKNFFWEARYIHTYTFFPTRQYVYWEYVCCW